jgi:hypothetical protein
MKNQYLFNAAHATQAAQQVIAQPHAPATFTRTLAM